MDCLRPYLKPYAQPLVKREFLPTALLERDFWVTWRLVRRDGKLTKQPVCVNGEFTWSDPANWASFDKARWYAERMQHTGLGVVLHKGCGVAGMDIDHCRDLQTGELSNTALDILSLCPITYLEVSPGMDGLRGFVLGDCGGYTGNRKSIGLELYESQRFLTVTGNRITQSPMQLAQASFKQVGEVYMPKLPKRLNVAYTRPNTGTERLGVENLSRHHQQLLFSGVPQGQRSEAIYRMILILLGSGHSTSYVLDTLTNPAYQLSQKVQEKGSHTSQVRWLQPQIDKAMAYIESQPRTQHDRVEVNIIRGSD